MLFITPRITRLILIGLVLAGCAGASQSVQVPADWKEIQAEDKFSFFAPQDLAREETQGIDSFVGSYESPSMQLHFDYGMYSDPLRENGQPDFKAREITIQGFKARLVTFKNTGAVQPFPYIAAVHFPDLGDQRTRLTMVVRCKNSEHQKIAKQILQTLSFKAAKL